MKLLHDGQIEINIEIAKTLINEQFPQYRNLPIDEFDTTGTVNSIFRLGNNYYIRLPLMKIYANSILNEYKILPYLSKRLTIEIPHPIHLGIPNSLYPFHWGIYTWIDGDCYDNNKITNFQAIISELANFIKELHSVGLLADAPKAGRKPLADLNIMTIDALNNSKDEIDYKRTIEIWNYLVDTPFWNNKAVWIHADLLKSNVLIKNNHISGVIDFGSAGMGDPAFDIMPAWALFTFENRVVFREKIEIDDITWNRACAYALHQAAIGIPYYRKTNESFVKQSVYTINEIIKDNITIKK
jgi:aminoglycoside phosphotransferase (APT) family kinase protein